jgi:hypothetical protein
VSKFPRTKVGKVSLSRMIIGTNWFLGWSHTSAAKDSYIKATITPAKMADIIEVFLSAGVDTIMGLIQVPELHKAVQMAQDRTGKRVIVVSTPSMETAATPEAYDANSRTLDEQARLGAVFCMPHQVTTDAMVDRTNRSLPGMDKLCAMIRQRGMIPGLSTHMPETPVYADESGLDVATYIQLYNAAGFLMQIEVDWVHRMIWKCDKPVMTIKPMAAGRLLPLVGLAFAWSTLRPIDMVTVGTMTPDEARECIELSLSLLEGREDKVKLQRTRSKASVERRS